MQGNSVQASLIPFLLLFFQGLKLLKIGLRFCRLRFLFSFDVLDLACSILSHSFTSLLPKHLGDLHLGVDVGLHFARIKGVG